MDKLRPRTRHVHRLHAIEHLAIERDVLGLAVIVELLAHTLADFLADLGGIDRGVEPTADGEQPL